MKKTIKHNPPSSYFIAILICFFIFINQQVFSQSNDPDQDNDDWVYLNIPQLSKEETVYFRVMSTSNSIYHQKQAAEELLELARGGFISQEDPYTWEIVSNLLLSDMEIIHSPNTGIVIPSNYETKSKALEILLYLGGQQAFAILKDFTRLTRDRSFLVLAYETIESLQPYPDDELYEIMIRDMKRNLNNPQGSSVLISVLKAIYAIHESTDAINSLELFEQVVDIAQYSGVQHIRNYALSLAKYLLGGDWEYN